MGLDLDLFEGDVPEELVCALCQKVVVSPVQSGQCPHLFCAACLKRSENNQAAATCPTCGASLKGEDKAVALPRQPSVDVKVKLLGLVVHCSHKCGKVCSLAELPDHVGDDCPNAPVPCPHARRGCKMSVKRSEVEEHAEECDYRYVQCEACGQRTLFLDLFTHQSRKRCLEKKLRQQVIKAVRITNTEVKLHKRYLERQNLRLELQQRQRYMDHHRQATTVAKAQRHHKNHPDNTKAISGSGGGNSSSSCNGSEFETPSVVSTEIVSFDPHHPAPPTRDVFLTSSKTIGEAEEEGSEKTVTLYTHPLLSSSRLGGSTVSKCRNCKRQFRENLNSPTACRWHPGPIIELFGGTCYSCGRLDYQKGCMMGYHEL